MRLPHIDTLSFWLGFLAASLAWLVISRFWKNVPSIRSYIKSRLDAAREKRLAGVGVYVRQDTLRRAQQAHLAHNLFALEEVVLPSALLAPPSYMVHPEKQVYGDTIASYILPYLPDWPELAAQYPAETITAAEALSKGVNIAVIGQPGAGKTVCMAHLASQLARRDPDTGILADHIPLWIHALDLDVSEVGLAAPVMYLIRLVSTRLPVMVSRRLPNFLNQLLRSGKMVLFIDGLDELPPARFQSTCQFINALLSQFPRVRVIVSASPDYLDGLLLSGFTPLGITAWGDQQRKDLVDRWITAWNESALPEIQKRGQAQQIDPILIQNWLSGETGYLTPLEWTLKVWSLLAGDVRGPSTIDAILSYLDRYNTKGLPIQGLQAFGAELIANAQPAMSYNNLEKFLNRFKIQDEIIEELRPSTDQVAGVEAEQKKRKIRGKKISSAGRAIEKLLETGIFYEYREEQIAFSHPFIAGFLGAQLVDPTRALEIVEGGIWATASTGMRFLAAQNKVSSWILLGSGPDCGPLYQRLLSGARWLSSAPAADWRSPLMRQLVAMLHQEDLPFSVRARVVSAMVATNDPSLSVLFKQLLISNSASIRQLSALGSGAIRDIRAMDDLIGLFVDPVPEVYLAACLAAGAMHTRASKQVMAETMLRGDENLRQASAETLATDPQEGHPVLQKALENPDLLTRRAGVYGLARIRADWSRSLLEKIAVEDGQWVVRNAASQVLEDYKNPLNPIPEPMAPAHKSSWLIEFAGKEGVGIPAGDPAVEMLVKALETGTENQRLGAMNYLKDHPQEEIIRALYDQLYQQSGLLEEAAAYTLWYMSAGGAVLPSPQKFGL